MTLESLAQDFITSGPVSHALFGALGGVVYCAIARLHGMSLTKTDVVLRPFVGAVAAITLTDLLGLPNHFTSLFAGYFGLDVFEGASAAWKRRHPGVMPPGPGNPPK